ncbi:MAG TPA: hypothetical protein VF656_08575 [Pyrinomonadaceae bacterium]|jgi:hypothetical protein
MSGTATDEGGARAAESVAPGGETRTPAHRSALVEEATRVATTLNEKLPPLTDAPNASGNHKPAPERAQPHAGEDAHADGAHAPQVFEDEAADEDKPLESATAAAATAQHETRGRIRQRAASVGDNLRPRVEKLREASTVVFDEATDDPGLRFVIVASVLFILFVLIFILSYILG